MRTFRRLLPVLIALAVAVGVVLRGGGQASGPSAEAMVTRVVDGDTIIVDVGGREERVRYIGIDTPESVKPNTPVQCFAKAASKENAALVEGQRVRLVRDVSERDRYGRLLAYVYRAQDGLFVNDELVRRGYAHATPYPPDVRYEGRFRAAEGEAREALRGLWKDC